MIDNHSPLNRKTPEVTELMMLVCFFSVFSRDGYSEEKTPADPNKTPTLVKLHTITPSSTIQEYGVSNLREGVSLLSILVTASPQH